jgi:hypothetical protein
MPLWEGTAHQVAPLLSEQEERLPPCLAEFQEVSLEDIAYYVRGYMNLSTDPTTIPVMSTAL